MTYTLKEAFDAQFEHVLFDKKLAHAFYKYQFGFINRNRDHLEFFGGNLLGVQVIRFKDADVNMFFNQVLDVDYMALTMDVRAVTTIEHEYKISGDILNLTLMYLIHRVLTSPRMTADIRETAAYNLGLIFFYRCVCALMSDWFTYPADEKIAQKAYANLSNKYLIKSLGSWIKVMEYRARDLISRKGLHRTALERFTDDASIVYAINDSQGRIRDLMKNYYAEFKKVHDDGSSIGISSGTISDADGEEALKEKTRGADNYVTYAQHLITDPQGFVRSDLIEVVVGINTNTSNKTVTTVVQWFCDNYHNQTHHKQIDLFLKLVVMQTMHLIEYNVPPSRRKDLAFVLQTLKNLYLSTRSSDQDLAQIREIGEKVVTHANGKMSKSLMMATRTSLILYISLRVLAGKSM